MCLYVTRMARRDWSDFNIVSPSWYNIELLDDFEVYIEKYIYQEDVIFTATPKASR